MNIVLVLRRLGKAGKFDVRGCRVYNGHLCNTLIRMGVCQRMGQRLHTIIVK